MELGYGVCVRVRAHVGGVMTSFCILPFTIAPLPRKATSHPVIYGVKYGISALSTVCTWESIHVSKNPGKRGSQPQGENPLCTTVRVFRGKASSPSVQNL